MGNIILQIVICILIPSLFLCLFLDKNGRFLILSLLAGIFACLIAYAFHNNVIAKIYGGISSYYITTISPVIEEFLKCIPIYILLKCSGADTKNITGISFTVGIGFSVIENLYFLVSSASESGIIWMLSRCIGTGLMHSISATVIGTCINYSLKDKRLSFEFLLSAYFFSAMYHGLFNFLVQSDTYKSIAILIPVISYLAISFYIYKDELLSLSLDD